jgi:hypothetical protein
VSHLFTTSPAERDLLVRQGYQDETLSAGPMYVFDRAVLHAGVRTLPLRRLHQPSTGDRFYPADPDEAFEAISSLGYQDETRLDAIWVLPANPVNPVSLAGPPSSTRLYQLWNPALRDHFLTTDPDETKPGYGPRPARQAVAVLKLPEMAEGITATRLFRLFLP